mmetsp:Transcript_50433/g.122980  ORF Transcript_50433/g.122980 Transcript_50433/m.122980 type:complete len:469 (-) Transcript_50433:180-1586(-)
MRLHVAVHDALRVQVREPREHVPREAPHGALAHRSEHLEHARHRAPRHVLHPDEGRVRRHHLGGQKVNNVGVLQPLQERALPLERQPRRLARPPRHLRPQVDAFDGDLAAVLDENDVHSAIGSLPQQPPLPPVHAAAPVRLAQRHVPLVDVVPPPLLEAFACLIDAEAALAARRRRVLPALARQPAHTPLRGRGAAWGALGGGLLHPLHARPAGLDGREKVAETSNLLLQGLYHPPHLRLRALGVVQELATTSLTHTARAPLRPAALLLQPLFPQEALHALPAADVPHDPPHPPPALPAVLAVGLAQKLPHLPPGCLPEPAGPRAAPVPPEARLIDGVCLLHARGRRGEVYRGPSAHAASMRVGSGDDAAFERLQLCLSGEEQLPGQNLELGGEHAQVLHGDVPVVLVHVDPLCPSLLHASFSGPEAHGERAGHAVYSAGHALGVVRGRDPAQVPWVWPALLRTHLWS